MEITHAVRIQSDKERNNVSEEFFAAKEGAGFAPLQYVIPALSSTAAPSTVAARKVHQSILAAEAVTGRHSSTYSAVERRNMQWNSFAMQCCPAYTTKEGVESSSEYYYSQQRDSADIGTRLASQPPYAVSLDALEISCTHSSSIQKDQIMRVLNGSVVGLCIQNSTKKKQSVMEECVGLGIVRSVNIATRMLYILTSVHDQAVLKSVNHLVIGKLDLPPHLLQTNQFKSPYLALHAMTAEGTAAGAGKSRNNLLRASQL
jgi:polynucleotide 5'-hydroxyl-kinase GRC3/NOL9